MSARTPCEKSNKLSNVFRSLGHMVCLLVYIFVVTLLGWVFHVVFLVFVVVFMVVLSVFLFCLIVSTRRYGREVVLEFLLTRKGIIG